MAALRGRALTVCIVGVVAWFTFGAVGQIASAGTQMPHSLDLKSVCRDLRAAGYFRGSGECPPMVAKLSQAGRLTKTKMKKLNDSMSYEDVEHLAGPGSFSSSTNINGEATFDWRGPKPKTYVLVTFIDDALSAPVVVDRCSVKC
jgi:hypothetical protein